MNSHSTATVASSEQPRAALQDDDTSLGKVELEVVKLPPESTCHVRQSTVDGAHGVCEVATSNQRISASEDNVPTSSTGQTEQDVDLVSGHGDGPCSNEKSENATPSAFDSPFEDISVDGSDLACGSIVVNSTKQTAITETSTSEPLFEDISMDGEMGQSTTTSRSGQDAVAELGSLTDSGGLKTDAQGGSKVLQTCFTGVLSPGGHCRHSNALQESTTSAHYSQSTNTTPITQEEDPANGEQSISLHSTSGSQSGSKSSRRKRRRQAETMEHSGLECAAVKKAKGPPTSDELVLCLRLQRVDDDSSPEKVADELVRCLQEVRAPTSHLKFCNESRG